MIALALLCLPYATPATFPIQDLGAIEKTLKRTADKAGFDNGGYDAAKALANIQTEKAMEIRLEYYDKRLDTYRGVYLRDWFYSGMLKAQSVEETELLAKFAANKKASPLLRLLCIQALGRCPGPVKAKPLMHKNLLKCKDKDLFLAFQRAVGNAYTEGRIVLSGWRKKNPDSEVLDLLRSGAGIGLLSLRELTTKDRKLLLTKGKEATSKNDRAEILRGLAARGDFNPEELLPVIEAALRTEHTGLRAAAIEACLKKEIGFSVPHFIEALAREVASEGNRFVVDYGNTLMQLTGLKLGRNPEVWERWWENQGEEWLENGAKPTRGSMARPEEETKATLFGIPIHSNRVVFAVDGSGSMNDPFGAGTAAEGARNELEKLLNLLPENSLFDVIVIEREMISGLGKLSENSSKNKEKALELIDRCEFSQASALFDAMESLQTGWNADTIVLIGDGGSSWGKHQYPGHLLEGLQLLQTRYGTRIHCVAIGKAAKVRFLSSLSELSGGTMVEPKG